MDYIAQDILSGNQGNVDQPELGQGLDARPTADGPFGYYEVRQQRRVSRTSGSSLRARSATPTSACSSRTRGRSTTSLTVNLGLRTENESVPSYSRTRTCRIRATSSASATSWHRASASHGTSRATARTRSTATGASSTTSSSSNWVCSSFGGDKWISHYYTLDTPNWDTLDVSGCPTDLPGHVPRRSDRLPSSVQRGDRPGHRADEAAGMVLRLRAGTGAAHWQLRPLHPQAD